MSRARNVAVISDRVWRTHFGGDRAAVGTSLRLNGELFEIVGVMPPGFEFPRQNTGVWTPMSFVERDRERNSHSFHVAARMKTGESLTSARADIEQIGRALQQRYPENKDEGSTVALMSETWIDTLRAMLTTLMAAVALVLLIGCVNIANLQLGRAVARRREFVLRLSLGAGLGRLARQLFAESLVLESRRRAGGVVLTWLARVRPISVMTSAFRSRPFRARWRWPIDWPRAGCSPQARRVRPQQPCVWICAARWPRRREPNALLREGDRGSPAARQAWPVACWWHSKWRSPSSCCAGGPADQEPRRN